MMAKTKLFRSTMLVLLVLPLASLAGCTSEANNWIRLDADEFAVAIDDEEGAFLLDTRTQDEWEADGHLENATLIPHDEISERTGELPDDKSTTILLYCAVETGLRQLLKRYWTSDIQMFVTLKLESTGGRMLDTPSSTEREEPSINLNFTRTTRG